MRVVAVLIASIGASLVLSSIAPDAGILAHFILGVVIGVIGFGL